MARWLKILGVILAVILVVLGAVAGWTHHKLAGSLPVLNGQVEIAGLASPVAIERDALGVPTIRGENRADVARALGFLHAQERYFQMDLLRRQAAGELAELFGPAAVAADRASRIHRFRSRARQTLDAISAEERVIVAAYTDGVNAGLAALREKPFEYVLLHLEPAPWRPEDSVLVVYAMYFVLNDSRGRRESALGLLEDLLPAELAAFLAPAGTEWDAPLVGEAFVTPPIPNTAIPAQGLVAASVTAPHRRALQTPASAGSNNWAVGASHTADGRAILANDMHLPLAVPNTWYRAMFVWPAEDGCPKEHRMVGVTLPGVPAIVVGSNTRVAWGFTNSHGDWSDLVILETDPSDPYRYRTPDGWHDLEHDEEVISVRGGEPESVEVVSTVWGPVVDEDHLGRPRSLHWIAHDPGSVNLALLDLEHVGTVEGAFEVANRSGMPPQNFVCADSAGNIGWTIMGRIPRRSGFSGRVPTSWADGSRGWHGWVQPDEYPRIINPLGGIIWTANARVVDGEMLALIGDGGYDLGARARQIRDDLRALDRPTEADMLAVQLDDRALFLDRWRSLLLAVLDEEALADHPKRAELRKLVETTWTGRASIDSQAFRLVRAFRSFTFDRVYGRLTAACKDADENFDAHRIPQTEGPLWRLVSERPPQLLDPGVTSWREVLLEIVDSTIDYYETEVGGELADQTWGARNTLSMRHVLSRAIPPLAQWLDMPRRPLPGDSNMPRVQSPSFGASERMAVSPGHEEEGYFHMPGGQSGHPMSPHYRAGHEAWASGRPTPLLPGPAESMLVLVPAD